MGVIRKEQDKQKELEKSEKQNITQEEEGNKRNKKDKLTKETGK